MQQLMPCTKRCIPDPLHFYSLLLAACTTLLLALATHDLAQHHDTIAIHKSNAREALTVLESVAHQWLLRLEGALRHLIRLQGVRLHLFLSPSSTRASKCDMQTDRNARNRSVNSPP